jgi:hypothetical protein
MKIYGGGNIQIFLKIDFKNHYHQKQHTIPPLLSFILM